MKFTKSLIFCISTLLFTLAAIAQDVTVSGIIRDEKGMPVPNATVLLKGTAKSAVSDIDGNFQLKTPSNGVLIVSYVGYVTVTEIVNGRTKMDIQLEPELQSLKEVVINVGYGSQKKSKLTTAVSTVRADVFADRPIYSVAQALQGNAAGIAVTQPSGKPGSGLDVRIRGLNSINSGNNPLYVIDGIQTTNIDGINTDDIVDMQILKDASATAIYGVNGASGVIIITTKRGKANKNIFEFNSFVGISNVVKNIDVLNLGQYKTMLAEINPSYLSNANNPRYEGINTNWADKVLDTGVDQNYNFSYAGGTDNLRIYGALGYQNTKGVISPSEYKRLSGKLNVDANLTQWLKLNASLNVINSDLSNIGDNNSVGQGGAVMSLFVTPSFMPAYGSELKVRDKDASGNYTDGYKDGQFAKNPYQSAWENPVSLLARQNISNINRVLSNFGFEATLLKDLVWKTNLSTDIKVQEDKYFVDAYRSSAGRVNDNDTTVDKGYGNVTNSQNVNINFENTLGYKISKNKNDINLLFGNSLQKNKEDWTRISGRGFATDVRSFESREAKIITENQVREKEITNASFFGRAIYTFDNKYILSGVFRASGVSQLSKDNKWGYFPGISGAWIISNENFLKENKVVNQLKIRGGWGQTGNVSGIPAYSSYDLNYTDPINNGTSLDQIGNSDLRWETNTDINIGLDLGVLNNRIKFTTDVYKKNTKNLLQVIYFPGFSQPYYYNVGEIQNKGVEFSIDTQNFKGDFKWNTNFNISFNSNVINKLGLQKTLDLQTLTSVGEKVVRLEEGKSLGTFYGYKVDKVDPATGSLLYKDTNGDGQVTPDDRTEIGSAMPQYVFGLTNNFSYKGAYLDVLVTGSQGNDVYNASRMDLTLMSDFKNQSTEVLNRWTTPGQVTNTPRANDPNALHVSDRFVEDGSYVRIKAVTIGYKFTKPVLGLNSLSIYATAQNLYTFTKYKGFDPEVGAFNDNKGVTPGIDLGTYPQVKTFVFGIKASF